MSNQYTPVRHHYEDVPPYNYTGIDDQIDGSYYTGSYWNLLLAGGANQTQTQDVNTTTTTTTDSVRTTADEVSRVACSMWHDLTYLCCVCLLFTLQTAFNRPTTIVGVAAKSKTLPEGSNLRQGKHQRSLSESKTTDVLSLLGGVPNPTGVSFCPMHYQHRIRYNSCTDSNTSGVSSCESVTGRTAAAAAAAAANMSDFQQFPLSPIPSISNLQELPMERSVKLIRRTSLLGTSFLQPALSPLAMKGYAQLRSLRANSRPVFSELTAEFYDFIDTVHPRDVPHRKYSWGESSRRLKVRSLDRATMLNLFS